MGSTQMQALRKVQLPLARRTLMLAVNQTIMMALSMVVIASLIGGAGLGDTIISSLTYLDVGSAAIGGAAIVFLAIALDRATAAAGERSIRDASHGGTGGPTQAPAAPDGRVNRDRGGVDTGRAGPRRGCVPESSSARAGELVNWINSAVAWAESPPTRSIPSTSGSATSSSTGCSSRCVFMGEPRGGSIVGAIAIALTLSGWHQAITVGVLLTAIGVMGVWTTRWTRRRR